eukprot:Blabericola_migrator_1__3750@NODE_2123_length_3237_cov_672_250789_g427_i1_p2_GENE_NODE_2123_length_3237_cov_672_250789_g427_i1NODE_2123_length_3237_cov_672_250789_g427_i1_p2_ORF_typecomplete_len168_score11_20_NODE_2123_length_3237_cov_672_250789_g427_i179582
MQLFKFLALIVGLASLAAANQCEDVCRVPVEIVHWTLGPVIVYSNRFRLDPMCHGYLLQVNNLVCREGEWWLHMVSKYGSGVGVRVVGEHRYVVKPWNFVEFVLADEKRIMYFITAVLIPGLLALGCAITLLFLPSEPASATKARTSPTQQPPMMARSITDASTDCE